MSRVGKKAVGIPSGVEASVNQQVLTVKGPKDTLVLRIPDEVSVVIDAGSIKVRQCDGAPSAAAVQGLVRSLAANMIEGVTKGFSKHLEIQGVGFRAALQGQTLELFLGYPKPVAVAVPKGLDVKVSENVNILVTGADKQLVGDFTARVRALFPAEPYKGKGIRYKGERVRHKVGKTVA